MTETVPSERQQSAEDDVSRRELMRLKWLTTIVPGAAVLVVSLRYETLEHLLPGIPPEVGDVVVSLLVLFLTYAFASFVFKVVERVYERAVQRGREVAALNASMDERARLSRELHDGLTQLVAFLLVRLDTVAGLVQAERRQEAMGELEQLREVANDLYLDVREAIEGLRSRVDDRGLVPTLRDYLDEFAERYQIGALLETDDPLPQVPDLIGMQLFRITQEALANVSKHARARQAWVRLRSPKPGVLELEIRDDGIGFDPTSTSRATPRSFGLASMRERAEGLGGTLTIETTHDSGTRIVVSAPLEQRRVGRQKEVRRAAVASASR